jgi:hypothetical protein
MAANNVPETVLGPEDLKNLIENTNDTSLKEVLSG